MMIDTIVEKTLPELRKVQNYESASIVSLISRAGYSFQDIGIGKMFDVQSAIINAAKKEGITLDYSEKEGIPEGLPFCIDAVIKKPDAITSCVIKWTDCGMKCIEELSSVETRIIPNEIQVRFFNGYGLLHGEIWPLTSIQSHEILRLLDRDVQKWPTNNIMSDICDGSLWKIKLYAKGRLAKTIEGNDAPPAPGQKIKEKLAEIIGQDNCYLF